MARVGATERKKFKDAITQILVSDDHKFSKTLMETFIEKAKELEDQGIDPKDIKIEIWIIPKPRKPVDQDPANYFTRKVDWFGLDFISLNSTIEAAINPVYSTANESVLLEFYNQVVTMKRFNIYYRFVHPKIEPVTEACEIIIPENQITR